MEIRTANEDDAVEACRILRRSITELCHADHDDDPAVVANWLQNKTPENVRSWISHPASYVVVATDTTRITGVGSFVRFSPRKLRSALKHWTLRPCGDFFPPENKDIFQQKQGRLLLEIGQLL